ncbi:Flp family type IVb pilin [Bordetella sp. LUAb4]|uniref:Flp family type IVb pilin n=1 Tax=Bordetella sp. LUAb4 TaxID=2843195 RepID=UPI001E608C38|nr:Flp family type IVb pilin [Bordetella sp. LUAb4]
MQMQQLKHFWKDEEGATAIEYGLIAGLVAVVIIGGLSVLGPSLKDLFTTISTKVDNAKNGTTSAPAAGS